MKPKRLLDHSLKFDWMFIVLTLALMSVGVSLVYSATGCEVSDVMIGGKMVMRDRQLTTIDEERVLHEVERIAARYR